MDLQIGHNRHSLTMVFACWRKGLMSGCVMSCLNSVIFDS